MTVKLLSEHQLEKINFKMLAAQARLSLHLSKCHIVGNQMLRLRYTQMIKLPSVLQEEFYIQVQSSQHSCTGPGITMPP